MGLFRTAAAIVENPKRPLRWKVFEVGLLVAAWSFVILAVLLFTTGHESWKPVIGIAVLFAAGVTWRGWYSMPRA